MRSIDSRIRISFLEELEGEHGLALYEWAHAAMPTNGKLVVRRTLLLLVLDNVVQNAPIDAEAELGVDVLK